MKNFTAIKYCLIALVSLFFASRALAQQADIFATFTGKWQIDMKKTDFERLRVPNWILPRAMDVKLKKETLTIDSKWYDEGMAQHFYTEYLPFDGSSYELILADGGKRIVSLKPDYQGSRLVLSVHTFKSNGDRDRDFTEIWALEDGGKTLTIDRKASQANDYSIKVYYNRNK